MHGEFLHQDAQDEGVVRGKDDLEQGQDEDHRQSFVQTHSLLRKKDRP